MQKILETEFGSFLTLAGIVSNGLDLVQAVEFHKPALVITDIKMQKLDGLTACKILKARFTGIKVLFMTLLEDVKVVEYALSIGCDGYVLKSSPIEEIIEAISTVIKGQTYLCSSIGGVRGQLIVTRLALEALNCQA